MNNATEFGIGGGGVLEGGGWCGGEGRGIENLYLMPSFIEYERAKLKYKVEFVRPSGAAYPIRISN